MFDAQIITFFDWLLVPIYVIVIYIVASYIKNKEIKKQPIYKYFLWGLFAKIVGAISVCIIYVYYYKEGGDTLSYHSSSQVMVNLLLYSPNDFFKVWLGGFEKEFYYYFNNETGYPYYSPTDIHAWNVVRFVTPFELLGFKSYLISSVLIAVVCYSGIWKLFKLFTLIYPELTKSFVLSVLLFPSVVFWGSGMLKDSWTIAAAGWLTYSFYFVFIKREKLFINIIAILVASSILILIKPYIFIAILPGCLLWGVWSRIITVKNWLVRLLIVPVIFILGISIGFIVWSFVSSDLGDFSSIDKMIQKAAVSSEDLKQDYYQGNSFDLGTFDPTLAGVMSKFPQAVVAGLFRPYIWEAKNMVMVLSGLENLLILGFTLYVLFRKPKTAFTNLFTNPLVLFCLIFAVFFAFSVAISTSNFGAMVRLRIPQMPFYLSALLIIDFLGRKKNAGASLPLNK